MKTQFEVEETDKDVLAGGPFHSRGSWDGEFDYGGGVRNECASETDEGAVVPGTEYADEPGKTIDCEGCPEVVPRIRRISVRWAMLEWELGLP